MPSSRESATSIGRSAPVSWRRTSKTTNTLADGLRTTLASSAAPSAGALGFAAISAAACCGSATTGSGSASGAGAVVSRLSQAPSNCAACARTVSALTIHVPDGCSISIGSGRRSPTTCSAQVAVGRYSRL